MFNQSHHTLLKAFGFACFSFVLFNACNGQASLSQKEEAYYLALGDSIAKEAQSAFLQNVASAIKTGGPAYAVDFCNTHALQITDSLAQLHHVSLQRKSDKNRNPENALETETDRQAWERVRSGKSHFVQKDDKGVIYYYKPISIAMPACLTCHGRKDEIAPEARKAIAEKYPHDKAFDYQMGDLRGMWKMELPARSVDK